MCIGIPMRVMAREPGFATCVGRGSTCRVSLALTGDVDVGGWVLVFKDSAVESLSAARAAEVNSALDLLQAALAGEPLPLDDPGFALPSAMPLEDLTVLAERPRFADQEPR